MFAYNIQTVNLYLNRTQILIPRMKRNATMRTKKRSLNTAWIDYRKAFGSVPHSCILKALGIYEVLPVIINFLQSIMKTKLFLNHTLESMKSDKINISCGIFQGDSPLLFSLSLIPLPNELSNTKYGYEIYEKSINHQSSG